MTKKFPLLRQIVLGRAEGELQQLIEGRIPRTRLPYFPMQPYFFKMYLPFIPFDIVDWRSPGRIGVGKDSA
eukprot:2982020-Heterocapsa_arctica.AAC.1